jgi:hypothetical protein
MGKDLQSGAALRARKKSETIGPGEGLKAGIGGGFSLLHAYGSRLFAVGLQEGGRMRIKVRDEKITKAIKKLEGIDIILKSVEDAKKAMQLIILRMDVSKAKDFEGLKDIVLTQVVEHPTSAMEHDIYYEIEFLLTDERFLEMEIRLIKELQSLFEKL